jgi:HEAT repeat protein
VGWAAAEALSNYPVKEAEDHLASLLWEERLRLRGAAIDALSAMRAMDKLPVIETFTDSEVPVLRARAASALVKMGSGSQISKCRELLKDPNPWVRAVAARSLKTRGEQSA